MVGNWDDADMGMNGCMHFERHGVLPSPDFVKMIFFFLLLLSFE